MTASPVYVPQEDSRLLIEAIEASGLAGQRRVLDLCTGSGVVAIAAAELGAASVTALDICPHAVRCTRQNARNAGVDIQVWEGHWTEALARGPFELIVANPPYVPTPPGSGPVPLGGPEWSWNGGVDGRAVIEPLCQSAAALLCRGGAMLLVQSVFADAGRSLTSLQATGLHAEVIASQWIPFGPVLSARADWLEGSGRIPPGLRQEKLVVIRADKP